MFEEYQVKNKVRNLSPSTIKGYREGFARFLSEVGEDILCTQVTSSSIDSFIENLMSTGLKPTSINHYLRGIRSFLYWSMEEGYVQQFKVRLLREHEVIKPTYSDAQIRLLVREPSKEASFVEWRSWALACWFLATGNRAATACSIKMRHISLTEKEIHVVRNKSNHAVILPMSLELSHVLRKYIGMFRNMENHDEFLFCNIGNRQLTVNALKLSMNRYNRNRGVSMTGVHAFRHTFAKNWIRNTGDVFRLQKILGHKTLEMTKRYVSLFSEDLRERYEDYCPLDQIKYASNAKTVVVRKDNSPLPL